MQTVLVTGVAGFVGSHLARALLDRGYRVRGLDDLSTGRRQRVTDIADDPGFEFIEGDLRDRDTVECAVAGVDAVSHQAAVASVPASVESPMATTQVNVVGTTRLLEAAREAAVQRVVVASSSAVYGSDAPLPATESAPLAPESPYALSKVWTEQLALQYDDLYGLETLALRYFNVYGPDQRPDADYASVVPALASRMLAGERPVVHGDGRQTRDFVYVDDVVEANLLALAGDGHGEVFNVASGDRTSVNDLVAALNDVLGTELEPRHVDPRPGDVRHSGADASRARARLGFTADTSLREGLTETVAALREASQTTP